MQSTTNYGLNIVEGTDIVNPLTQFNPNFTDIDTIMKANADASVDHATCIKTGTVHAVTRTNTGASVFRFTATGNWNTGDTMTVDGTLVSVYVSDGTSPADGCFVINSEVLAAIQGTRVTLFVNSGDASNVSFDDSSVSYTANNVQTALDYASTGAGTEYNAGVSVKDMLDSLLARGGFLQFKVVYVGANSNITFDTGTYMLLFLKNQYSQSALYTIESGLNPCQIGGQPNAIVQTENAGRITLNLNNTYGTAILAKLYVTSNNDEINVING